MGHFKLTLMKHDYGEICFEVRLVDVKDGELLFLLKVVIVECLVILEILYFILHGDCNKLSFPKNIT